MPTLPGTNLIAPIVPFSEFDTFPTHLSFYGKGGFRTVSTFVARDNIPEDRRESGMIVYVEANDRYYKLNSGLTNLDWQDYTKLTHQKDEIQCVNNQLTYTLSSTPLAGSNFQVFLNGLILREGSGYDYTVVADELILNNGWSQVNNLDFLQIYYFS